MRRLLARCSALLLTIGMLATAGSATAGSAAASDPGRPARRTDRATTVRLLTHDSFNVSDDVLAAFTKRTGIEVEILRAGDAGTMVNQAILTKDNPVADVLFGVDNTFLTRALDAGIFEPYRSPALDTVPEPLQLDPKHRVTPVDYGDVCINYDKEWFAEKRVAVPKRLRDLTKPAYRGLLVVEDPSTSSPGLAFLLATISEFGPRGWERFWRDLRANDVKVVDGWEQAYYDEFRGGGAGGTRPLVVSYASSPPAAVYYSETPLEESPIGTMTSSCFRQVEFAGVLRGTEHRGAARKLVDFLLSEKFQADIPLQMFVFPAREGTPLPEVFEKFADVPESPYTLSPTQIGKHRDTWIREWTDTVVR